MIKKAYLIFLTLIFCSCAPKEPLSQSPTGPGFQAETFKGASSKRVFELCESLLANDGYSLKDANSNLGFITAQKAMDPDVFFKNKIYLLRNSGERNAKKVLIDVSLQVVPMKRDSKVRLSLIRKLINESGQVTAADPLIDDPTYKDFFSKLKIEIEKKSP